MHSGAGRLAPMPTVDLESVTIAYDVYDSDDPDPAAEPILLICGCGGPAAGWFGIVPALTAAGYRVVTFDNRGMAPSSSPPAPYTVADLVADTLGLCDHLGIHTATFVGHSMGGWVAETIAIRHPERARAAAFLGSCNVATSWEKTITTVERDLARLGYDLPPLFFATETLRYLPNSDLQQDAIVDGWIALIGDMPAWPNPGRLGQYEACLAWSLDSGRTQAWPSIRVPCLVIAFEHDIDSPPQRAREAAANIPGAGYVEIPGASHLGPFTHPVAVADALIDFLASESSLRRP